MNLILLGTPAYKMQCLHQKVCAAFNNVFDKVLGASSTIILSLFMKAPPVYAAQGDRIITIIKSITQDIYSDFVYLSLGFVTVVCIYHLIMIVFTSGDERGRNSHVKAIFTALIAWAIINVFAFFINKIFGLTGQNTPADIFNTGSYNG